MKFMMSFFTMLFVFSDFFLIAQQYDYINRPLRDFQDNYRFVNQGNESAVNAKIEGTPYFNSNLVNGEIYTQESERFTDVPMRYNAYSDEIEFKMPDGALCVFSDPEKIFQVKLNEEILVYTDYVFENAVKSGFLFSMYEGKSKLYQRRYKVLNPEVPSNGIINAIPARYADKPIEYYLQVGNKIAQRINTKKDLIKLYDDHTSEVEKYMKEENVKINDPDDLKKVLTYYDAL